MHALNDHCACAGADEATQIAYALNKAGVWNRFQHMRLDCQKRVRNHELWEVQHAIGYGLYETVSGQSHNVCSTQRVRLPRRLFPADVATPEAINSARNEVFAASKNHNAQMNAAIVCATNALADEHNDTLLEKLDGDCKQYAARDVIKHNGEPLETFNSTNCTSEMAPAFDAPGTAPAALRL